MITIQQAYQQLLIQLYEIYDNREAANIAELVFENITGFTRIDRIINNAFVLSEAQTSKLNGYSNRLLQHEPVQYVLGEAWFAGMKFFVDNDVLIPRPETEELVEWIVDVVKENQHRVSSILDIGTGSGCIAIALKKKLSKANVFAVDVSEKALNVAKQNATQQHVTINFMQLDILNATLWQQLSLFDVIVSNPPYITEKEKNEMYANVIKHEPHLALFVADDNALLFYKAIAAFGKQHLHSNGLLFFEINEAFGDKMIKLLSNEGYKNIELKKDLQGRDRMIKAQLLR